MSADNFYIIRKDPHGLFVPVMGFASNEDLPALGSRHPRFTTIAAAMAYANADYSEYGTSVHEECFTDIAPSLEENEGHVNGCLLYYYPNAEPRKCACETIVNDWYIKIEPTD